MKNNIFEYLKEDVTKIAERKNYTMAKNINALKTRGNNMKSLASIFQVAIYFHPSHPQPKTLVNSFSTLI